jgi:phosphotransferase system  glucose/maltose/N-acetylglucosamine-specific IIC component
MNTVVSGRPAARVVRPPFYLVMSVVMAAVIVAGFSRTVPDDLRANPGLPLLMHVHGAVFTLWLLLFVAQPALAVRGSLRLHRRLGWVGAGLAAAMVVMALAATWYAIRFHVVPSFFPPTIFLVMNTIGIAVFAGLVFAGVRLRKQAEWHKRLMLCATLSIMGPGLGRLLPMESFGRAAPMVMFGAIMAFCLVGPFYDIIVRRRVHPAYIWGVAVILVSMLVTAPIAFLPATQALVNLIRA